MKLNNHFLFSLFLFLIFTLSSLIFMGGCSKSGSGPDNNNTVTVSGKVTLEGESDHSGVTVSLYKPVELDTALVRINQQYPQIGVQISQETEFDHRTQTPVATTTTASDGSWQIDGVAKGSYNVVAEKEGWGWAYNLNVSGQNSGSLILHPVEMLSGALSNDVVLQANHHYRVTGDVTVQDGVTLTIEPGVWIRFAGFFRIEVFGTVLINQGAGQWVRLTSDAITPQKGDWRYIRINNLNKQTIVKKMIVEFSNDGLRVVNTENVLVDGLLTREHVNTGLIFSQVNNSLLKNVWCWETDRGMLLQNSMNLQVEQSVLTGNTEGIKLESTVATIRRNYFENNQTGIHAQFRPSATITHNEFHNNREGSFCAGSDPLYQANNFSGNEISIWIGTEYNSVNANPLIHFNNLLTNNFGIKMTGTATGHNLNNIDASNNWWGISSENLINDLIWDKEDAGADSVYIGRILFIPFLTSVVDSAGIQ